MERQVVSLREGRYLAPGVELKIQSKDNGTAVQAVLKEGTAVGWFFSPDGTFQSLQATSVSDVVVPVEGDVVFICPHITPVFEGLLFRIQGTVPAVCCLQCLGVSSANMYAGADEAVHAMDRELLEELIRHCHLVDLDEGVVHCPNSR